MALLYTFVAFFLLFLRHPSSQSLTTPFLRGRAFLKQAHDVSQPVHETDVAAKPPVWPSRFQQDFTEENYFIFFTLTTTGTYYYDFAAERTRIDRANGVGDRYCGSAMTGRQTPCTHLITDGMRYLIFPQEQYCCKCCNDESGCGVVKPNWLENATYLGHDYIYGVPTTKWNKPGLQNNYYWHAIDDVPVRIYMEYVNQMTFNHLSFSKPEAFNDSLFELPASMDCSPQCYGVCSLLGKGNSHKSVDVL